VLLVAIVGDVYLLCINNDVLVGKGLPILFGVVLDGLEVTQRWGSELRKGLLHFVDGLFHHLREASLGFGELLAPTGVMVMYEAFV
jgi:hypothetical protein